MRIVQISLCLQAESQPAHQSGTNTESINAHINKQFYLWESLVLLFQTALSFLSRVRALPIFLLPHLRAR